MTDSGHDLGSLRILLWASWDAAGEIPAAAAIADRLAELVEDVDYLLGRTRPEPAGKGADDGQSG
jgi:hypothetical protein